MDTLDSTNSDHHHRLEDWNEEDGGEEETETGVDKTFLTFQKAISAYPDQVMRYVRVVYGEPSIPLWVSDEGQPQEGDIVGCALCGSPRTFEFQILPQLLHALNVDHSQPDALDWGTLLVYSCSSNCETDGRTVEEVVWRQDFSSQGIGDKYKQAV
jgi:pre-rRNA-processing protein TSR4